MKQQGFILIASLIFLLIMTMIGVSMFGGFNTDERMSGNFREKSRSRDAAQTALNAAAFWMASGNNTYTGVWNTGATCTTITGTPSICNSALAAPAAPATWTTFVTYTPSVMTVNALGGVANIYASAPNYHIQYLGLKGAREALYLTTASATGGNAASTTVLRTVYSVTVGSGDLGL